MSNFDYFDQIAEEWISSGEEPETVGKLSTSESLYIQLVVELRKLRLPDGSRAVPGMDRIGRAWMAELIQRHR